MEKRIEVGACYRDSSIFWSEWRVERVIADFLKMPHAIIVSLSDPTESRTIACPILSDKRRFHLIEAQEAQEEPNTEAEHELPPSHDTDQGELTLPCAA